MKSNEGTIVAIIHVLESTLSSNVHSEAGFFLFFFFYTPRLQRVSVDLTCICKTHTHIQTHTGTNMKVHSWSSDEKQSRTLVAYSLASLRYLMSFALRSTFSLLLRCYSPLSFPRPCNHFRSSPHSYEYLSMFYDDTAEIIFLSFFSSFVWHFFFFLFFYFLFYFSSLHELF